jgi:indolepyruvate ferredoxin oxidoreductase
MSVRVDTTYRLEDRFERESGRLYLTGWDALVRLPLMQRRRDVAAGLNTAGFVTGYPGSPLGGLDTLLRNQRAMLAEHHVHFEPGVNEDLAATSIWGSQYLNHGPVQSRYDGVFGMWYGKGPGLERSTDAMRTASYQGVAEHGGVLALAGDDHNARSTVTAQQSEVLFVHMHMPVLNPATVQEYLDYGLTGWALSRFASTWVGMIALNDTVDSAATVDVDPLRPELVVPDDVERPPKFGTPRAGGVGGAAQLEYEIRTLRLPAAQAFARANRLDRVVVDAKRPGPTHRGLGIIASGKAYLDVLDGLARLGLDVDRAAALGISVYKVAMPYPLEPLGVLEFVDGLDEVLVVEPKYPLIEDQVSRLLRRLPAERRPDIVGKTDEHGAPLVPEVGALDAISVSAAILRRLERFVDRDVLEAMRPRERLGALTLTATSVAQDDVDEEDGEQQGEQLVRAAGFCSGCPHNTSTKVPEGSWGIGGTGCHGMAIALAAPGRETHMFTHMGGEGALWIGMAPFAELPHAFQNMGDGTYSHSGYMAIRAAIAANVNMTFKILLNGYISMTGGQAIPGGLPAHRIAAQVLAEGARKVVVVSDDPSKYGDRREFPTGVEIEHRDRLIEVQEELRRIPGVTVLIYDQPCAAELRRERKRGRAAEPNKRVFIHDAVCEGCGDCNVQSNCISVEPLDTDLGRKRVINQSTCNKDFSCVDGYCPSFVTLIGAQPRRRGTVVRGRSAGSIASELPEPAIAASDDPYNILVGGIGGGGVLTIGAIVGMAAHLEGKSASVLNESGLAQKNGAVQSHVRIASDPGAALSPRIAERSADLVIGADIVVVSSAGPLAAMAAGRTWAVINDEVRPTVAFSRNGDQDLSPNGMIKTLRRATGGAIECVDAHRLATALMGDSIYANLFLLGFAAQRGRLPVSIAAIERAIEINGVAVAANKEAFTWGRLAAADLARVETIAADGDVPSVIVEDGSLESLIARRRELLTKYQDRAYADRYEQAVRRVIAVERERTPGHDELSTAVARNLAKLMAYKDEYEVARLFVDPSFRRRIDAEFEGDFELRFNLAPQILNRRDERTGRARKIEVPATIAMPAFRALAAARRLRGTKLDVFGRTPHRRAERARIDEYLTMLDEVLERLTPETHGLAVQLASLPDTIRGFDTVKDESARQAAEKQAFLLDELRQRTSLASS